MNSLTATTTDPHREKAYRYPGTRPFYGTNTDRRLFFGREAESKRLLHRVLTSDLVVLFGKSGSGKTSLVNAGLNEQLRIGVFMPLPVRFNDLSLEAVPTVFARIKDLANGRGLNYNNGNENSLWEFFKTSAFPLQGLACYSNWRICWNPHCRKERKNCPPSKKPQKKC